MGEREEIVGEDRAQAAADARAAGEERSIIPAVRENLGTHLDLTLFTAFLTRAFAAANAAGQMDETVRTQ